MENDVFSLTVDVEPVVDVFATDEVATQGDTFVLPEVASSEDSGDTLPGDDCGEEHLYAFDGNEMIVGSLHLTATGTYDETLAYYGSLGGDGGIEQYAFVMNVAHFGIEQHG